MKRLLALSLALIMTFAFFAGLTASAEEAGKKPIKVTSALAAFESLDPYNTTGHTMVIMGYSLYETLWTVDEQGKEIGNLAKSWTVNGTTIDVEIYDYIYDSAGNHITADDVVFAYNYVKELGTNRNARFFGSVTKTGDYSVRIEMTVEPYITLLSGTRVYIVSEKAYKDPANDFVNKPIGTGHYTVKEFVSGTKAVFQKAEKHWQSDRDESLVPYLYKANADEVEFDVILESQQVQTGLETGALQAGGINVTIAGQLEGNNKVNVVKRPGNYNHTIMFNCYDGPFKDNLALRQAVCYAIDKAMIAQAVTRGTGHQCYTVGNESLVGYQAKWESEDYYNLDLAKAKELMAEAGYPNGGLTLRWLGKTDEFVTLTAQIVQANLAELGIELKIQSLDNTTYMSNRPAGSKEWDLCWGDSVPKGNFALGYQSYADTSLYEYGNICGIKDDHLQELLISALYGQQAEDIDALHLYVKEGAWLLGSYVDFNFYGVAPGITMTFANDGEPIPNAFVFAEDYSVFVNN